MPLFNNVTSLGYDLDLELHFIVHADVRLLLGTAGSLILACPTCGEEHFRDYFHWTHRPDIYQCFKRHGQLEPVRLDQLKKWDDLWSGVPGGRLVPVEERRTRRLTHEAESPGHFHRFGNNFEADYPDGYKEWIR